nr:aminodeoxychorismate synthase component I [Bowmanella dokdonensis]
MTNLFAHFSHQSWAMLLDSAGSAHINGDFDILLADPVAHIQTFGPYSQIWRSDRQQIDESDTDPLTLVETLNLELFGTFPDDARFPFICGAAGYFAYDLGRRFERLPEQAHQDIQAPEMAVGFYSWAVLRQRQSGQSWLVSHPDFPAPTSSELMALAAQSRPATSKFRLTGDWQANMSKVTYLQKLARIHEYLLAGDCYQVNLAQRFSAAYKGDEWQAYQVLRDANQAPFSAFIRLPGACVMSISPERFLSVNQGKVQTKPIKGTRPRMADPQLDKQMASELSESQKDRAENLMIVDLLRNDLSKHCQPGSVAVPELFAIESFAAVHHLVSTVEGTLEDGASPLDLLRGAFPGGSITGAPKIRAMQIIEELEPHRRHIYCGSIGYLSAQGRMDTSICIRTLLCENGTIHCWAGGGIVLDSDAESEYQETLHKVNKILPVLSQSS